jgi:hypothetical protein
MISYFTQQHTQTACNVIISGLLAGSYLGVYAETACTPPSQQKLLPTAYDATSNSPSFSEPIDRLGAARENQADKDFTEAVSKFYSKLVEDQEPLGDQFASVLNDNLWELYER